MAAPYCAAIDRPVSLSGARPVTISGRGILHPVYRRLVGLALDELRVIEDHLGQLD